MRRACLLLLLALVCSVFAGSCARRQPPPEARPTPPPRPQPSPAHGSPREAVTAYLRALQDGEYARAYRLLSAESRRRHSLPEFSRQAREGVPDFALSSARVALTRSDRAEVTLQLEGDPAQATIVAVREEGEWRVLYLRGRPGFPYP